MIKKHQILEIFFVILLVGCSKSSIISSPTHPAPIIETTKIIHPTQPPVTATLTIQPTLTGIATLAPSLTLQVTKITPNEKIIKSCLPILNGIPKDYVSDGSLVMISKHKPVVLDLRTGIEKELPIETDYMSVSPDGKRYAIQVPNKVSVFSATGEILQVFTVQEDWYLDKWLNNQQLIFTSYTYTDPGQMWPDYPPISYAVNPYSMETIKLSPGLPYITPGSPGIRWFDYGLPVYDPLLTRAVYPARKDSDFGLLLWDIESNQEVTFIKGLFNFAPKVWTQDGSRFLINDDGEFYSISRDGVATQLTQFSSPDSSSSSYSWSPDEQNIAFWLILEDGTQSLALFDTKIGHAEDFCIKFGEFDVHVEPNFPSLPLWSLTGKQIVFQIMPNWDVIVVDIEKRLAFQVTENRVVSAYRYPLGWLAQVDER